MRRLLVIAALVAACGGTPQTVPWDSGVPVGGRVVYTAPVGVGICGLSGCPTRIIDIDGLCVTEAWRGSHWEFRSSKPCHDDK